MFEAVPERLLWVMCVFLGIERSGLCRNDPMTQSACEANPRDTQRLLSEELLVFSGVAHHEFPPASHCDHLRRREYSVLFLPSLPNRSSAMQHHSSWFWRGTAAIGVHPTLIASGHPCTGSYCFSKAAALPSHPLLTNTSVKTANTHLQHR